MVKEVHWRFLSLLQSAVSVRKNKSESTTTRGRGTVSTLSCGWRKHSCQALPMFPLDNAVSRSSNCFTTSLSSTEKRSVDTAKEMGNITLLLKWRPQSPRHNDPPPIVGRFRKQKPADVRCIALVALLLCNLTCHHLKNLDLVKYHKMHHQSNGPFPEILCARSAHFGNSGGKVARHATKCFTTRKNEMSTV